MRRPASPKNNNLRILRTTAVVLLFLLSTIAPQAADAQEDPLSVHIARPYEGETIYAGPTSLIYRIPISGWVLSAKTDPSQITVRLEIFHSSESIGATEKQVHSDGTYSFTVTVNPQGSRGSFTATQEWCMISCHSPGSLNLQPGELLIHVTASAPSGERASTERHIFVDHSEYTYLPIQVVEKDGDGIGNIRISASTWLYLWRARSSIGTTNEDGLVQLKVEALTGAPTEYSVYVEPTIIDGVLYTGDFIEKVTLQPSAESVPRLTITLSSQTGQITGSLLQSEDLDLSLVTIAAISLPDGVIHRTRADEGGHFTFEQIPIAQYLLTIDPPPDPTRRITSDDQKVDLTITPYETVLLPTSIVNCSSIHGTILDGNSRPIPFAWITAETTGQKLKMPPGGGVLWFEGLNDEKQRFKVDAPGFYSQYTELDLNAGIPPEFTLNLKPQADVLSYSWGDGSVFVPAESTAEHSESEITLQQGWLWGQNNTPEHLTIITPTAKMMSLNAEFALEYLHDRSAWLYVFSGQVDVRSALNGQSIVLSGGQMVNLNNNKIIIPVAIDPLVINAFQSNEDSVISSVWEPTAGEKLANWAAHVGVGAVQILTMIVHALASLAILLIPIIAVIRWWKRRISE